MSNENDFMGGGGVSLKFEKVGDIHKGKLLSIKVQDDREPSGKAKLWPDGNPMKVYLWELEQADGTAATIWVRGNLVSVLREACKKAGAASQDDLIGAEVMVKHHELGEATTKGFAQPKLYQAIVTLGKPQEKPEYDPFLEK